MKQPDLILFAHEPRPGRVKTRLMPHRSPEQAAEIAAFMLRATVERATSSWPGEIFLYCAPDTGHPLFHGLAREFGVHLAAQQGAEPCERMLNALRAHTARGRGGAGVLCCDVPHCNGEFLDQANEWLVRGLNVLGPTDDGGYYFLGLQQARPELFDGVRRDSPALLLEILERAQRHGIYFEMLPALRDVDAPEDLWLVAQKYAPLRQFL